MEKIAQLQEARKAAIAALDAALDARKAVTDKVSSEGRSDLTEDETADLAVKRSAVTAAKDLVADLDAQIADAKDDLERSGRNDAETRKVLTATVEVRERPTYEKHNGSSYFQDFTLSQLNRADEGAKERLRRHVVDVETSKELRQAAKVGTEFRNLDRNDGSGGEFVPPLWLLNEFAALARSGRPYANLVKSRPLPKGTDSISIPKVATGTTTAIQTADNATISETDATTTSYSAPVRTIAGMQGISLQSLEQSPLSFDDIILADLAADYAVKLDQQVISGSGSSGQVTGVRNTSSIVTITGTSAGTELEKAQMAYKKIGDGIQRVHTARYLSPEVIVMHPRRWAAFLTLFTSDGRLAIVPDGAGVNQIGVLENVAPENVVGRMQGIPVVVDSNIPTTIGAGTNQDVIHVLRSSDLNLYESSLRTAVFNEVRATSLTVLVRLHGYMAFSAARYPQSVVEVTGTSLTAPTFA